MAFIAHLACWRLTSNLIYLAIFSGNIFRQYFQAIFSGNNDLIKVALLNAPLYKG